MCGRFTLIAPGNTIAESFELDETPIVAPRYNVAPTQPVAAVVQSMASSNGPQRGRQLSLFHWGLIPGWAKDPSMGARLINARAETVAEKPSFRAAFKYRRCLIPADGFYEWQKQNGQKQPFYIRLGDGNLFAFAGLWEHWQGPDGSEIESCTILTTEANELVRPLHGRMPVILKPEDYALWLDPQVQKPDRLQPLLGPYPAEAMVFYPVSQRVNSPRNDDPQCIAPMDH